MKTILDYLKQIKAARYGKDVREAIYNSIHQCYEDGKAGTVDLIARESIEENQTEISKLKNQVQISETGISENKNNIDLLKARMDTFTSLPAGSTSGDAALNDIKIGYDGTEYPTPGNAVRGQVSSLSEKNDNLYALMNIVNNWPITDNSYIQSNGELKYSSSWQVLHMIPVFEKSKLFLFGNVSVLSGDENAYNVVCYDESHKYLGGAYRSTDGAMYHDYAEIQLLSGTRYISIANTTVNMSSKFKAYICSDYQAAKVLNNYATTWQFLNGGAVITIEGGTINIDFKSAENFACRRVNGVDYKQTTVLKSSDNSVEIDGDSVPFVKKWWAIYIQDESESSYSIHAIESSEWQNLFVLDKFVLAVFYSSILVYVAPSTYGIDVLGVPNVPPFDHGKEVYLSRGRIEIDTTEKTIQVTERILASSNKKAYIFIEPNDTPVLFNDNVGVGTMCIMAYDEYTKQINFYNSDLFQSSVNRLHYIASWYNYKFYNPNINPSMSIVLNDVTHFAGELFETETSNTYVEQRYRNYINNVISNGEEDTLGDIVTPSHWDCMEGRQFSMFFDCLSRNEGRMNLYRITNSKSLTRNEYCMNYTPTEEDSDFSVDVIRLDANTMEDRETKKVSVRVHHPLKTKVTRNICICGDSLVDNNYVATEIYRMLAEDGDCDVNQIGTRGPSNGKHEGRGSWKWSDYIADTNYSGKTNAFWNEEKGRLDFQKYCETNGFGGIDYFLIALGTNDVSQGYTLYRTEAQVEKFIAYAKQFVDALLNSETGYPNCKIGIGLCGPGSDYSYLVNNNMGIFRKSINTLNLALIKTFDEGKYNSNVTCFAHGLRADRRLAFPYTNEPVNDRFDETSRTLTNSIHPSARGYYAWADGYYCQIRAWLEEDA